MSTRKSFLVGLGVFAAAISMMSVAPRGAYAQAANGPKKRIAILDFDYSTITHWWGAGEWNVGKGVADLIVNDLVKDGTYSLIERNKLDAVLKEQQLGQSNTIDPTTASQVGKVLGVNALVTGSITQFGFDDKSIGLGGFGAKLGGGLFGGAHQKTSKATVVVTARLIDPSTGEILVTAEGKGESKRGSFGGFGGGWGNGGAGGGGFDMTNSNFQDTILGEATNKCCQDLAAQIVAQAAKVSATQISILGKVADVDGNTVIINVGKDAGVGVGDVLSIERVTRTVKDPDTGKVIKEVTDVLGTLKITSVDAKSATGTFSGSGPAKAGDRVKSK